MSRGILASVLLNNAIHIDCQNHIISCACKDVLNLRVNDCKRKIGRVSHNLFNFQWFRCRNFVSLYTHKRKKTNPSSTTFAFFLFLFVFFSHTLMITFLYRIIDFYTFHVIFFIKYEINSSENP